MTLLFADPGHASLSREELFALALAKRAEAQAQIAVISGSHGKSTVKEMLASILQCWRPGDFFASPGNQNTKMALASQLSALPATCKAAIFEVGARKVHDFEIPFSFLQPKIVCLLNIGSAHTGIFGSQELLEKTKLSVLYQPTAQILVVPETGMIFEEARKTGKKILVFGKQPPFEISVQWKGPHAQENAAAACALAQAFDIPRQFIEKGLRNFSGMAGRFEIRVWQDKTIVDDAFNASPETMAAGLRRFAQLYGSVPCVLVLGSMLELGEFAPQMHREIGKLAHQLFPSAFLITVGEEAADLNEQFRLEGGQEARHFGSAGAAKEFLLNNQQPWKACYIKGSKATGLHNLF